MKNRIIFAVMVLCLVPIPVFAYVDPGSGMLLWQGLIAAIGALLVFIRNPWQGLKNLFARFRKR